MKKYSQREARSLAARVKVLEQQENERRSAWRSDWPNGVNIMTLDVHETSFAVISTARKLGHAVVVTPINKSTLMFHALQLSKEDK